MKDVLGALLAFLLDCKWLLIFLALCALVYAKAAEAGTPAEVLRTITHGQDVVIVILKDHGSCKEAGAHKTFGIDTGLFDTGCATISKDDEITVVWDGGGTFVLPAPQLKEWRPGPLLGPNPLEGLKL